MIRLSDFVIKFFENKDIKSAFSVTGGGCMYLNDALRKSNKIQTYFFHHEQSLIMAAEGYYRMSSELSLNLVTTGPGGTNTITGLLGLWTDSIPAIIISGQVSTSQLSENTGCRQIGDQEFDIVKLVKSTTKYSVTIKNKDDIHSELAKAYKIAREGRPGPVWIDIPLDIQNSMVEELYLDFDDFKLEPEKCDYKKFKDFILSSKRPLFILGNGVRLSNSTNIINEIIQKYNIPFVTGPHSCLDAADNTLKQYAGRIGILGQKTSNEILQECDLVIGLGTRCPVKMTGYNVEKFAPKAKKIFIDIDKNELNKHNFSIDLKINCDLNIFLSSLKNDVLNVNFEKWCNEVIEIRKNQEYFHKKHLNMAEYLSFYFFIYKAKDYFKNLPIVTSNGTAHVITQQMYRLNKGQRLFTNVGCASMGYGLPASIGACIALDKSPIICIEGDGSIMMNLQELQTVKHHNLPIKIFIINNDGYLSMKMTQNLFFNGLQFGSDKKSGVSLPEYKKIAESFGIKYYSISSNSEIDKLTQIIQDNSPMIIELFCHPYEKHEPKVEARGIDENGKIIPGLLTDMYISENFE